MLIDDTQPEETRVVVVNGNKIEDVEFESSSRKQIKGNVYLAKVMRIEPSLQAAFVDYGGNRHGFLAFGEIHPDYYNVSPEQMAALEQEVDTIIENKKQAIKEREAERARIREEKALRRAQRLEQEAAEAEAKAKAEQKQTAEADVEAIAPEAASTIAENTEAPAAATEEAKPARHRGRRPKTPKAEEQPAKVVATKEETSAAVENKAAPAAEENAIPTAEEQPTEVSKRRRHRKVPVTTLAESSGTEEETVYAENEEFEGEEEPAHDNGADEEVSADEDDDSEYDFEVQKKLILMRKLFYQSKIQDVIKEGQILLVQVVKEERGNKGAALTTYLSLAGRYCVLMPNRIKSGGVSRKITNVSDRKRLKGIIKELPISSEMSLIVRTAGEEKTKSDIVRDYNYLIRTWNQIRLDALKSEVPALIYEEGNLIKRALRDMFTKEVAEIIVDGNNAYQAARNFMRILSPHNLKKLKCCKANDIPLFQRFQIEGQLDKLHDTNVQLESGGYLVINPTEALVSIDVNSGRATKEKDLEETALKTNLEAADEIAKQLRMRNLAGLVVIDFIDMDEPKNNQAIEKRMKEAMKKDRARVQIGKMSCFGLLEISRQRMHSSFFESNYQTCPCCHGRGIVRTIESGAIAVLRAIEEEGNRSRSAKINVFLPDETAIYLLNQKRQKLCELEQKYKMQIIISADSNIKNVADYRIERTKLTKENAPEATTAVKEPVAEEAPAAVESEMAAATAEPTPSRENDAAEENGEHGYRRRGRRYRFDRRRRNYDRNADENRGEAGSAAQTAAPTPAADEPTAAEQPEKRKVTWWKRLIKG